MLLSVGRTPDMISVKNWMGGGQYDSYTPQYCFILQLNEGRKLEMCHERLVKEFRSVCDPDCSWPDII